jgi:hypothetical protein
MMDDGVGPLYLMHNKRNIPDKGKIIALRVLLLVQKSRVEEILRPLPYSSSLFLSRCANELFKRGILLPGVMASEVSMA